MARLYVLRRWLARLICPESDPRYAFELGKWVGQMGDDVPLFIPHPVTRHVVPATADVFGPLRKEICRQARSWWILPCVFAGLLLWIGFFKLIGVL